MELVGTQVVLCMHSDSSQHVLKDGLRVRICIEECETSRRVDIEETYTKNLR